MAADDRSARTTGRSGVKQLRLGVTAPRAHANHVISMLKKEKKKHTKLTAAKFSCTPAGTVRIRRGSRVRVALPSLLSPLRNAARLARGWPLSPHPNCDLLCVEGGCEKLRAKIAWNAEWRAWLRWCVNMAESLTGATLHHHHHHPYLKHM